MANCHMVIAGAERHLRPHRNPPGAVAVPGVSRRVAALGERRTIELALTGRIFGAREAREMGLVHEIAAGPERRALEVAAARGFQPHRHPKRLELRPGSAGQGLGTAGQIARRIRDEVFAAAISEGIRAFREKRPPRWPSLRRLWGQSPHKICGFTGYKIIVVEVLYFSSQRV